MICHQFPNLMPHPLRQHPLSSFKNVFWWNPFFWFLFLYIFLLFKIFFNHMPNTIVAGYIFFNPTSCLKHLLQSKDFFWNFSWSSWDRTHLEKFVLLTHIKQSSLQMLILSATEIFGLAVWAASSFSRTRFDPFRWAWIWRWGHRWVSSPNSKSAKVQQAMHKLPLWFWISGPHVKRVSTCT